jgi:hypothetical protein
MGLIIEPKGVDFSGASKPWTKEELRDFRKLMAALNLKYDREKKSMAKGKATAKRKTRIVV